ncbi:heterogeneous nuclear ribonucleoprotein 87F-like isoform X4 [Parasteatoda tepidariorum]|uniref:heterogeneous nuclear ribonucleoprotein 87F-like isoform X4 n=1 Tax=Parasteatoda tepidariorum TaxID=114398 RepID=UPI000A2C0190|nr:trihydrophobin-like isoform X4 [Parasteatoda tepidariorum]
MNSAMKIFMMIFVVAVISLTCEAQRPKSNNIGYGGSRGSGGYRGGYGSRNQNSYPGRGTRNQGNQGGDTSQRSGQDAFNVNFGSGGLNNGQTNQGSQSGRQRNLNGAN